MPVTKREIERLQKAIAAARKRHSRWITRRNKLLLKWGLEGVDLATNNVAHHLYAWEIANAKASMDSYTARLLEVKCDPQ